VSEDIKDKESTVVRGLAELQSYTRESKAEEERRMEEKFAALFS